MKKFIILIGSIFILCINTSYAQCGDALIDVCHGKLGDFRFLKSFPVQHEQQQAGASLPVTRYSMVMNAGTTYRIVVCNAQELPGKAIFSLYFQDNLIITSYNIETKTHFPFIEFTSSRSGLYHIDFYFEDGREGCAMGVVAGEK